jgi:hypothetical protein
MAVKWTLEVISDASNIFWDVTQHGNVDIYHVFVELPVSIFRVPYYISTRLSGITSQKTVMFIVTAVKNAHLRKYKIRIYTRVSSCYNNTLPTMIIIFCVPHVQLQAVRKYWLLGYIRMNICHNLNMLTYQIYCILLSLYYICITSTLYNIYSLETW